MLAQGTVTPRHNRATTVNYGILPPFLRNQTKDGGNDHDLQGETTR